MTPINVLAPHSLNVAVPKLLRQLEQTAEVVTDVNAPDRHELLDEHYKLLDTLLADLLAKIRHDLNAGKLTPPIRFRRY